jgi:hypothetical protein
MRLLKMAAPTPLLPTTLLLRRRWRPARVASTWVPAQTIMPVLAMLRT